VLGIVVAGPLADRWGAKGFAIGGDAIMALSLVGMSLAPDYGTLALGPSRFGARAPLDAAARVDTQIQRRRPDAPMRQRPSDGVRMKGKSGVRLFKPVPRADT
jgi:predicted MFS family arabinose efflux permease